MAHAPVLPLYCHPTTVVLVDDDRSSLAILQHGLDNSFVKQTFRQARSALSWLGDAFRAAGKLQQPVVISEPDANAAARGIGAELEEIYRYVGDPARFTLPTVVVIDYSMPDMDGIEFCQAMGNMPCRKILFTALADETVAVDAFNRGLIDRFIRKQQPNSLDMLERDIATLQTDYFVQQSRSQVAQLERQTYGFLYDTAVFALVQRLCDQYGFVEYYLLTNPTGYLLFDGEGRSTVLVIQTRASLHGQADVARDAGADEALLDELMRGQVVPLFCTDDGMWHPDATGAPEDYCKPAEVCTGREDYYWALFEPPAHFAKSVPYSHRRFLRESSVAD